VVAGGIGEVLLDAEVPRSVNIKYENTQKFWLARAQSRRGQSGAGGAPDRRDAAAGRGENSDRGQGDEAEEDCILDEILPVLICDEGREKVFHCLIHAPLCVVCPFQTENLR
jgi:hypothetical protein